MGGFASSRILEVHGERMIKRTFDPGFRIELHQKDLNLALTSATPARRVAAEHRDRARSCSTPARRTAARPGTIPPWCALSNSWPTTKSGARLDAKARREEHDRSAGHEPRKAGQRRPSSEEIPMPNFLKSLFGQVVVALVLGVVIGVIWPDFAVQLKPLGDGFIKFIKMAIGPLVFGVVVHGIVGAGDLKKVGRVGLKALIYFEAVTTLALLLGVVLAYTFGPGVGMNIDPKALDAKALGSYTEHVREVTNTVDSC